MCVYIYISVHRCIASLCMRSEVVRGLIRVQSAVSQVLKWHRKLKGPKRLLGFQSRLVSFEDEQPCFLQRLKWFRTAETSSALRLSNTSGFPQSFNSSITSLDGVTCFLRVAHHKASQLTLSTSAARSPKEATDSGLQLFMRTVVRE